MRIVAGACKNPQPKSVTKTAAAEQEHATGCDRTERLSRGGLRQPCILTILSDVNEQTIKIQLPDGSVREVPRGTTANDVAMSISPRLAAAAVVARIRPLAAASANGTQATDDTSEAAMAAFFEAERPENIN